MGMHRTADRDEVWKTLVESGGNRDLAAEALRISLRTLNRYLKDYNLYPDMDKAGYIRHPGPPRGKEAGTSRREDAILRAIRKHSGELDYGELAVELYGADNDKSRQRVYSALNDLKLKGTIASDGKRWFVLAK